MGEKFSQQLKPQLRRVLTNDVLKDDALSRIEMLIESTAVNYPSS
jgi:hypothetical protein